MERTQGIAPLDRFLGGTGLGQRLVWTQRKIRIQLGIEGFDSLIKELHQLRDRHLFRPDKPAHFNG